MIGNGGQLDYGQNPGHTLANLKGQSLTTDSSFIQATLSGPLNKQALSIGIRFYELFRSPRSKNAT